jgi:hypothetical protein
MSTAEARCTSCEMAIGGSEEGWNESNGSILTTLEPVAIMPSGDLAA